MQLALKFLVSYWRELLIASLTCALGVSMLHGRVLSARLDTKIAVIDSMRREAQTYKENSEQIAKEISDAHRQHVLAAEKNAYENAKRRFGTVARCPTGGIGTRGVLPPAQHDHGETGSAGGTDVPTEEQVAVGAAFITDCAYDAGTVMMWQDWARRNQLSPVTD